MYQGDNTEAFGGNFLTVYLRCKEMVWNAETEQWEWTGNYVPPPPILKAEIRTGCLCKVVMNPTFPLTINFNEEESAKLNIKNSIAMAVWDMQNRKHTVDGSYVFNTLPRKV